MALTGTEATLKAAASAAAKAAMIGQTWTGGGVTDNAALTVLCDAIGAAVATAVAHIVSNATVSPVGTPAPLTAPPGGGPVAGTGAIV